MSSFSDVEHFSTILSGCEAFSNGDTRSPDAVYALTVLQLHANDAGIHAGQEGFMDAIKKGAKKTKQWILDLVKAVRAWLREKYKSAVKKAVTFLKGSPDKRIQDAALTKVATKLEELNKAYIRLETGEVGEGLEKANVSHSYSAQHAVIKKLVDSLDGSSSDFNGKTFFADLDKALEQAGEAIERLTEQAERLAKAIPEDRSAVDFEQKDKDAHAVARAINVLTGPAESLGRGVIALAEQVKATVDKGEGADKD